MITKKTYAKVIGIEHSSLQTKNLDEEKKKKYIPGLVGESWGLAIVETTETINIEMERKISKVFV